MKKILSGLLSFVLLLSLCVPATARTPVKIHPPLQTSVSAEEYAVTLSKVAGVAAKTTSSITEKIDTPSNDEIAFYAWRTSVTVSKLTIPAPIKSLVTKKLTEVHDLYYTAPELPPLEDIEEIIGELGDLLAKIDMDEVYAVRDAMMADIEQYGAITMETYTRAINLFKPLLDSNGQALLDQLLTEYTQNQAISPELQQAVMQYIISMMDEEEIQALIKEMYQGIGGWEGITGIIGSMQSGKDNYLMYLIQNAMQSNLGSLLQPGVSGDMSGIEDLLNGLLTKQDKK